jgi:hypothetical protein
MSSIKNRNLFLAPGEERCFCVGEKRRGVASTGLSQKVEICN